MGLLRLALRLALRIRVRRSIRARGRESVWLLGPSIARRVSERPLRFSHTHSSVHMRRARVTLSKMDVLILSANTRRVSRYIIE